MRGKGGLVQILVQDFANPLSVGFSENHSENEHGLPLEVMPRASAGAGRAGGGGSGGVGGGSWLCTCASKRSVGSDLSEYIGSRGQSQLYRRS